MLHLTRPDARLVPINFSLPETPTNPVVHVPPGAGWVTLATRAVDWADLGVVAITAQWVANLESHGQRLPGKVRLLRRRGFDADLLGGEVLSMAEIDIALDEFYPIARPELMAGETLTIEVHGPEGESGCYTAVSLVAEVLRECHERLPVPQVRPSAQGQQD